MTLAEVIREACNEGRKLDPSFRITLCTDDRGDLEIEATVIVWRHIDKGKRERVRRAQKWTTSGLEIGASSNADLPVAHAIRNVISGMLRNVKSIEGVVTG